MASKTEVILFVKWALRLWPRSWLVCGFRLIGWWQLVSRACLGLHVHCFT